MRPGLALTLLLPLIVAVADCTSRTEPSPTPPPVRTLPPTQIAGSELGTFILVPTATTGCENAAHFLEDLTLPDGTNVAPGATLDKRWSVQNNGTCDWGPDYRLVRQGDGALAGPSETALYPARAGSQAVWQVALTAPTQPGEYRSRWQARAPDGSLFGDEVFIIVVVQSATPTPALAGTPTP
jgi:hypothetical protein